MNAMSFSITSLVLRSYSSASTSTIRNVFGAMNASVVYLGRSSFEATTENIVKIASKGIDVLVGCLNTFYNNM